MAWQSEPCLPREQERRKQQVLEATSSCSSARYSKLTSDSATSCGLDVCHGKSLLFTAFQAACRASCLRRGRIPVLTRLCSFSLALRASLPAGLEQWHRGFPAASRRERSASARTENYSNCLYSPGEFRASWKIRNVKRGSRSPAEHTHTPCCFPREERTNTATRESSQSSRSPQGHSDPINTQITLKDS